MAALVLTLCCAVPLLASIAMAASCGVNDPKNYKSLADANAGSSTFIYVTGDLNVASSITVSKPLVIGYNSKIVIAAGAVLTLSAQPAHHRRWTAAYSSLFQGDGTVKFSGRANFLVMPEWWMRKEEATPGDFSPAFDRLKLACRDVSCTIIWTQPGKISKPLTLNPRLSFYSSNTPGLNGVGTNLGIDFQAGNYTANKPFMFPPLGSYSTAIRATSTIGLRLSSPSIGGCTNSVLVAGDVKNTAIDVALHGFVNNAFVSDANSLANVNLYSGFYTNSAQGDSAAMLFRRAPTSVSGATATFTAFDGVPRPGEPFNPNLAFLRSTATTPVDKFGFTIQAWAGNVHQDAKYATGVFNNLKMYAKMAALMGASVAGANDTINMGGSASIWSTQLFASQAAISETNDRNFQTVKLPYEIIPGEWVAGRDIDFFLRHKVLTGSGATQKILMSPGPTENGAGQDWLNPGIVVKRLEVLAGQVLKVTLTNAAGKSIFQSQFAGRFVPLDWRLYVGLPGVGL